MVKKNINGNNYTLVSKTIFFPKQGILAVGDLHLGYEQMLYNQGVILPFNQLETTKNEIGSIINRVRKDKIKKIVFLGDIKHNFRFEKSEKFDLNQLLEFLEKYVQQKNIILIRGNHDKTDLGGYNYKNYYLNGDIAFIHGDKLYREVLDKKIKIIVMSHIHSAVIISDEIKVKKEKFKCFLIGKFKEKKLIVVPSFLPLIQGSEINDGYTNKSNFSIITAKQLLNFKVYVVGKDRIYEFGKYKDLL